MNVILSHPTGNRNVRAVLSALECSGMLAKFNTTIAANPDAAWLNYFPATVRAEWLRRQYPIPNSKISTNPFLELSRMVLPKIGLGQFTTHEKGWASVDSVYQRLDRQTAKRLLRLKETDGVKVVYAYEDGALESFREAKKIGLKCIYDLPIAYWETSRRLMFEEAERLPSWSRTLGGGIRDSEQKLERKAQELELADLVIGPGKFVMESLPVWAKNKKLLVSPFGSPENSTFGLPQESALELKKKSNKLRVLFVGSMGQRKGLADLFSAIRQLNRDDIELVVMGSLMAPMDFYRKELPEFIYEKGRPNNQVLELMRSCDVFCLPSIVEGRALVMQEAMSRGLPLIITPNTGGEDLVVEGKTGFLVPIRNPSAIAEKLNWFLEHRQDIPEMGRLAKEHAGNYTWENYGKRIATGIATLLN